MQPLRKARAAARRRELAEEIDRHTAAVSAPPKPMTAEDARVLFDNLAQQADAEQDYAA